MCKLRGILSAAIFVWFVSTPSFAMPFSAQTVIDTDRSIENARLVCNELDAAGKRNRHLMHTLIRDMDTGQAIDL
jgi:hypothetical protein